MRPTDKSQGIPDEDLDIFGFLKKILNALVNTLVAITKGVIRFIVYILRKWILFGIVGLIGVLISFGVIMIIGDSYYSELIIRTNAIPVTEFKSEIDMLSGQFKDKAYDQLEQELGLTELEVRTIRSLNAYWVIDLRKDWLADYIDYNNNFNILDTLNGRMTDRIAIRIKSRTPGDYKFVRDAILGFISKNEYFINQNNLRLEQIRKMVTRVDHDIEQLDSLQKVKYFEESRGFSKNSSGQVVFLQEHQTQLIFEEIYELYTKREAYERELTLFPEICTVLKDFNPASQSLTGTIYYSIRIVPAIMILAFLLMLFFDFRNIIVDWTNKE